MELYINEVGEIREETVDGDDYIVAPARFIKAMRLHMGYVPSNEIVEATPRWDGVPIVTSHPKKGGSFISVNESDEPQLGHISDPKSIVEGDDTFTEGEVWISVNEAEDAGEEELVEAARDGETLAVSAAYRGSNLPPGVYDGQHRRNVKGDLKPDHVAVFVNEPDRKPRCSVGQGCAVGGELAANEVMVNAISDDSVSPEEGQDEDPRSLIERGFEMLGLSNSEVTVSADTDSEDTSNMGEKAEFLVNERGYDEENLPPEDSECFEKLHANEKKLQELEDTESTSDDTSADDVDDSGESDEQFDAIMDRLDEIEEKSVTADDIDEHVGEAIAANEKQTEKEELIGEIIANSEDYDEDDTETLMESPKPVLESLADNVQETEPVSANWRAKRGASANSSSNSMPSLSARERMKEMESDD